MVVVSKYKQGSILGYLRKLFMGVYLLFYSLIKHFLLGIKAVFMLLLPDF